MDELVKDLREISRNRAIPVRISETAKGAANAIENMSEAYDKLSRHMDDLAALMPRWISVAERLPEKNGPYLCCWKASADENMHIARVMVWRVDTGWMNAWDEPMSKYVTHWMPLPQPPEEENK